MPPASQGRAAVSFALEGLFAILIGLLSGFACAGVRLGFNALQHLLTGHAGSLPTAAAALSASHRAIIPVFGAAVATAIAWAGHRWLPLPAFEDYIDAVQRGGGAIPFAPTLLRTLSSAFSIASGAAVGREGSMIQFAAAVASSVGRHVRSSTPLTTRVAWGTAAAVAAAYKAPVAGALFALEIVLPEWRWSALPGLSLASCAGWFASRLLLGPDRLFAVSLPLTFTARDLLWLPVLAAVLGVAGPLYQFTLDSLRFTRRWPVPLLWGGLVVGLLSLAQPLVWGNGDVALETMLRSSPTLLAVGAIVALRLFATTACVGTGTVGGVFTPTLFLGAALARLAAPAVPSAHPGLLAIVGLTALLAATTHAPWMAACMAVELTGHWHLLPPLLAAALLASTVARALFPRAMYGIATQSPGARLHGKAVSTS